MKIGVSTKIILLCLGLVVFTSVSFGIFSYIKNTQAVTDSIVAQKQNELNLISLHIKSKIDELKNDVLFLSSTPPIKGILRASSNQGVDPIDNSTSKQWKDRLATIFKEIMHAKPNYEQVRFVGVQNGGKELVRVERQNSKLIRVQSEDLQQKAKESYFKKTLLIAPGKVYLSDFSANREFGKIVYPIQMMLRASTPVFKKRQEPFGFIIININYNKIFSEVSQFATKEDEYFVADKKNNILLHSNAEYFLKHPSEKLQNFSLYYPKLSNLDKRISAIINSEVVMSGERLFILKKLRYNPSDQTDFLSVFLVSNKESFLGQIQKRSNESIWFIFVLTVASLIISLYFSRYLSVPLRQLVLFAEQLGKDKNKTKTNKINIKSNDEIGLLAQRLNQLTEELSVKDLALKHQKEALDVSAIVAETDIKGKIVYVNKKLLEISKYSKNELLGNDHRLLNSGYHSKQFFHDLWQTIKAGNIWKGEIKNKTKEGNYYWVDTTIYPIRNFQGQIEKFIAIRFDITERKIVEEKILKETEKASAALAAKTAFFANMSHEIRTPLNGIIGFTDLLLEESHRDEIKEKITHIKECGEGLMIIINDILDVSKIEAGKLQLENISFSLKETIELVVSVFEPKLIEIDLKIVVNISKDTPDFITGDPVRLRQVLLNLVGNAVKFTDKGMISIEVDARNFGQNQEDDWELTFKVKDSGIGISLENQKKLFKSFEQIDASTNRKYGGTGLGLSICSHIITLMQGEIWVESQEGIGSNFIFTLKTKGSNFQTQKIGESSPEQVHHLFSNLRILVVEDNLLNQKLAKGIFNKIGIKKLSFSNNGQEAIDKLRSEFYDVVFMDVQMPVMNGIEATEYIRQNLNLSYRPYIIGLSANVFPEDKKRGLQAGMDAYLEKPLNRGQILEELKKVDRKLSQAS